METKKENKFLLCRENKMKDVISKLSDEQLCNLISFEFNQLIDKYGRYKTKKESEKESQL